MPLPTPSSAHSIIDDNSRRVRRRLATDRERGTCAITTILDEPVRLLSALRAAGCDVFIDPEDQALYVSPPMRRIDWDDDPEEAIKEWYWELKSLVKAERLSVHLRRRAGDTEVGARPRYHSCGFPRCRHNRNPDAAPINAAATSGHQANPVWTTMMVPTNSTMTKARTIHQKLREFIGVSYAQIHPASPTRSRPHSKP
jgi:hypothetical protein